jgi:hypothetical protein
MAVIGILNLCNPALCYLTVSVVFYVLILYQNLGSSDVYCVGDYFCNSSNIYMLFIIKALYIFIWTWISNYEPFRSF